MKLFTNGNDRANATSPRGICFEPFISHIVCGECKCVNAIGPCTGLHTYNSPMSLNGKKK